MQHFSFRSANRTSPSKGKLLPSRAVLQRGLLGAGKGNVWYCSWINRLIKPGARLENQASELAARQPCALALALSFVSSILSSSSPNALMSPGRELLFLWLFVGWSNRRCKFPRLFLNHKLFHHLYHRVHFLSQRSHVPTVTNLPQTVAPSKGGTDKSHTRRGKPWTGGWQNPGAWWTLQRSLVSGKTTHL